MHEQDAQTKPELFPNTQCLIFSGCESLLQKREGEKQASKQTRQKLS